MEYSKDTHPLLFFCINTDYRYKPDYGFKRLVCFAFMEFKVWFVFMPFYFFNAKSSLCI